MSTSPHGRCAECTTPLPAREENAHFPFCSARCKQIDLGKWLEEAYTLPVSHDQTERSLPNEDEQH